MKPPEFDDQLQRLIHADPNAAMDEWNRYYDRLINHARKSMKGIPRRAADEEDVVLSAMNSFFMGVREGRFIPRDRDELWRLLATITVRKATRQLRRHYALKRGGGQVRGESVFEHLAGRERGTPGINQIRDDKLLPEMSERLGNNCRELLALLPDETLRTIATLRLEGLTVAEIATRIGCSPATVKRKLDRIRKTWDRSDSESDAEDTSGR